MIPAVVTHYWWPLKQLTGGRWLVRRQLPARPWHTTQKKKHWHKNYEKILKNRLGTRVYHSRCATMHMYPAPRPWQKNAFGWLVEPSRIFLVLVPRVTLSCCFPTIPRLKSTIWRVVPDLTLLLPPPQKKTSCTNYKIYIFFIFSKPGSREQAIENNQPPLPTPNTVCLHNKQPFRTTAPKFMGGTRLGIDLKLTWHIFRAASMHPRVWGQATWKQKRILSAAQSGGPPTRRSE